MFRNRLRQVAQAAVTRGVRSRVTADTRNFSNRTKPTVFKLTVPIYWLQVQNISHIVRSKDDTTIYVYMLTDQIIEYEFDNDAQCDQFIANISKTRAKVKYEYDSDDGTSRYVEAFLKGRCNNH